MVKSTETAVAPSTQTAPVATKSAKAVSSTPASSSAPPAKKVPSTKAVVTPPAVATPAVAPVADAKVVAPKVVKPKVVKSAPIVATEASTTTVAPVAQESSAVAAPVADAAPVEFSQVLNSLNEVMKQVKDLCTQVKTLQKQVSKEHKDLEKASKGKRKKHSAPAVGGAEKPKRAPSGFAKPTGLSAELCQFLGVGVDTQLARTEVTKKITSYVKEHALQNQMNKKEIVPDTKLGGLLKVPKGEVLTYFNLQKYMKNHFKASTPAVAPAPVVA